MRHAEGDCSRLGDVVNGHLYPLISTMSYKRGRHFAILPNWLSNAPFVFVVARYHTSSESSNSAERRHETRLENGNTIQQQLDVGDQGLKTNPGTQQYSESVGCDSLRSGTRAATLDNSMPGGTTNLGVIISYLYSSTLSVRRSKTIEI